MQVKLIPMYRNPNAWPRVSATSTFKRLCFGKEWKIHMK